MSTTDYYAVEHIKQYIPQVVPQTTIDYVPVERKQLKYEYIPVERKLLHLPQQHQHLHGEEVAVEDTESGSKLGSKVYANLREEDFILWEQQYGYQRGDTVDSLNRKIREKIQRDKERYFQQFEEKYRH